MSHSGPAPPHPPTPFTLLKPINRSVTHLKGAFQTGGDHGPGLVPLSSASRILKELLSDRQTDRQAERPGRRLPRAPSGRPGRGVAAPPAHLTLTRCLNAFPAQNEDESLLSGKPHLASHSLCGAEKFSSTKRLCCRWPAICHIPSCYHLISRFCQVLGVKA